MLRRLCRALPLVCLLIALTAALRPVSGQPAPAANSGCPQALRVQSVKFVGTPKIDPLTMSELIVNEEPGFFGKLFRTAKYVCLDTLEVQRDALRLAVMHRQKGWFLANVTPLYDRKPDGVRLSFDVTPGPEARIDTLVVKGMPANDPDSLTYAAPLLSLRKQRFDRTDVQAMVDATVARLQSGGYPRAKQPSAVIAIDTTSASDTTAARVGLSFTFEPGARLRVGEVHVRIQGIGERRTVDSADIMALIRLRPGQYYSLNNVGLAQRDLYRTDAFRLVLIDTIAPRVGSPDSLIDFQLTVAEARTRYGRIGGGWATQDCGRVQARVQDRAFLAPGRRAELSARASKIGVGAPLDFAERMCSSFVRNDPFSEQLNYYGGLTITNTRFFGLPFAPRFSLYSERRSEPLSYLRETTLGGLFELSTTSWRRTVITPGVQYERGRTISDDAVSCIRFNLCQPNDDKVSLFGRGIAVVSTTLTHDRTNNPVNPAYGSRFRAELRGGVTSTTSQQRISFYRTGGEASGYAALLGGTIASRVQLSRVFAPNAPQVNGQPLLPQQERLFAGGQNSVRGFQQNLLGPVVYGVRSLNKTVVVERDGERFLEINPDSSYDLAVPRGGTALVVGNLEWRRRVSWPTDKLQIALFADAGTVFETNAQEFDWRDVRVTPGLGFRLDTPLGPFRLDIGYNPYELIGGRALLVVGRQGDIPGFIQCASPGNTIPIDADNRAALDLARCPSDFRPAVKGAFRRVVFHFSLGQAF